MDLKVVPGNLPKALGNRLAVAGTQGHDLQDEQVESAFEEFWLSCRHGNT